eukprot:2544484-Pleurochrysis_carterae.AAC.1
MYERMHSGRQILKAFPLLRASLVPHGQHACEILTENVAIRFNAYIWRGPSFRVDAADALQGAAYFQRESEANSSRAKLARANIELALSSIRAHSLPRA